MSVRLFPRLASLIGAVFLAVLASPAHAATVPGGRYGTVHADQPVGTMRGFLILFSDQAGWTDSDARVAEGLSRHGLFVVGVDTPRYAAALAAISETCHPLVGDAEAISHQLQRETRQAMYFTPILAGIGQGGVLAEQVLSDAPSNTIAGAVSLDPTVPLDPRFHPCPPDPTILHDPGLPGFWHIGYTSALPAAVQSLAATLRQEGAHLDIHGFAPGAADTDMLWSLLHRDTGSDAPDEEDVSDLPLVEMPPTRSLGMLAIVLSGDGGWRDLDQTIAHDLHDRGAGVIGWDSLRYFWSKKTPEQTATDLARVIRTYTLRWNARSVVLIGYSFGADVLPFAYNRLPSSLRKRVTMMSLLGFAAGADFEIRVTGWLGLPASSEALKAYPEVIKIPPRLLQCFYGRNEDDTICPELQQHGVAVIRTEGGHHFDGNYGNLARRILDEWKRRMTVG